MPRRCFVRVFIKSDLRLKLYCIISAVVLVGNFHAFPTDGAERAVSESIKATASTNEKTLDAVVIDVLEHNPELSFYTAEIAAAKGEARTAAIWANPELSTTIGDKRVTGGGLAAEGIAWSVSVRQTFEWPGRIPLRKAIANQQIQLAEVGLALVSLQSGPVTQTALFPLIEGRPVPPDDLDTLIEEGKLPENLRTIYRERAQQNEGKLEEITQKANQIYRTGLDQVKERVERSARELLETVARPIRKTWSRTTGGWSARTASRERVRASTVPKAARKRSASRSRCRPPCAASTSSTSPRRRS